MGDGSPKVARVLARYLVALVAQLEAQRGAVTEEERSQREAAWSAALRGLTASERDELERVAGALAGGLVAENCV
jgi:hypothetical protein